MITCNRCGKLIHAGSANCQYCGTPVSSGNADVTNSKNGALDQPELPAWLESLRASDQPSTPATGSSHFSTADLIEEGSLPSWLRPENNAMAEGISGQFPAMRSASMSAPNTDGGMMQPRGISAGSLIDQQALPSWMQENSQAGPQAPERGFSASSLIQPDALPDWMKNMEQTPPPAATSRSGPAAPFQNAPPNGFFEQQGPPPWQNQQGNQIAPPQSPPAFNPTPGREPTGFSASSLLDMNSLPSWLQEGSQNPQGPAQNLSTPMPSGQLGQGVDASGNLAASSLIDMNALPGWLRTENEQSPTGLPSNRPASPNQDYQENPYMQGTRPSIYDAPRIENMRVPSRPRAEAGPQEQSEVAANVFSSMLGVASSAPYFPSQPQQAGAPMMQTSSPQQMQQGGPQPPQQPSQPLQQMYPSGNYSPGGQGQPPQMNTMAQNRPPGYTGAPQQMPGYPPVGYPMDKQPGMPNPSGGMRPEQLQPNQQGNAQQTNGSRQGQNQNTAKRGIIETIRSWFTRQP